MLKEKGETDVKDDTFLTWFGDQIDGCHQFRELGRISWTLSWEDEGEFSFDWE